MGTLLTVIRLRACRLAWVGCALALAAPAFAADPAGGAPPPAFDVTEFRVLGNTTLPAVDVERAVYPFLGQSRTLNDVDAARAALEAVYHDRGYGTVFVDVPEQDVDDGIVRLRVVEGRLANVELSGARYFSGRQIRRAIPSAQPGVVPYLPALQEELQRANSQTPDRVVVPVMKAGAEPASVDLALKVDEHLPVHVGIEVNNAHTADTTPNRLLLDAHFSNPFGRLDDASLQFQTAPAQRKEVGVFAANYAAHFGDGRTQLALYYIHSNSDVASVGTIAVLGNGSILGSRLIQSFSDDARWQQSVSVGIDWKDFGQSVQVTSDESLSTPIKYVLWSAALDVGHRSQQTEWSVELAPSFGPRGGVNQVPEFANKCYQCRPNLFFLRGSARAAYHTVSGWSLAARFGGQAAGEPVVANEQYAIGGVQTVRGYLEADSLGDTGLSASAQLGTPSLSFGETFRFGPYAFFDLGRVTSLAPLAGQPPTTELRSVGVGLDFTLWRRVTGSAAWADPLVTTSHTPRGESRVLFSVRGSL